MITPENRDLLLADLRQRTGLPIKRVAIGRLNFLNDAAQLRVYFNEPDGKRWHRHEDTALADEIYQAMDNSL